MRKIAGCLVCVLVISVASIYADVIGNTDDEVRRIADPIMDNILDGMKSEDYMKYSRDFAKIMKGALPKEKFLTGNEQIKIIFGQYVSREYLGFLKKGNMTLVLWKARFDKTTDHVLIKLTLSKQDGKYLVTGLFFQ